jgi:hypothetical protein
MALHDLDRPAVHRRFGIAEQLILLGRRHQSERIAGLPIIIVAVAMIDLLHRPPQ